MKPNNIAQLVVLATVSACAVDGDADSVLGLDAIEHPPSQLGSVESVIGTDDRQHIGCLATSDPLRVDSRAVAGLVFAGLPGATPFCTAFVVSSNRLVVTAGHCLQDPMFTPQQMANATILRFGYERTGCTDKSSVATTVDISSPPTVLAYSYPGPGNAQDYAVLQYPASAATAMAPFGYLDADYDGFVSDGDHVVTIGHGNGGYKKYSRLFGSQPSAVGDGTVASTYQPNAFTHFSVNYDTEGGSSGGPVLVRFGSAWRWRGIHTNGANDSPPTWNYALYNDQLRSTIEGHAPSGACSNCHAQ